MRALGAESASLPVIEGFASARPRSRRTGFETVEQVCDEQEDEKLGSVKLRTALTAGVKKEANMVSVRQRSR